MVQNYSRHLKNKHSGEDSEDLRTYNQPQLTASSFFGKKRPNVEIRESLEEDTGGIESLSDDGASEEVEEMHLIEKRTKITTQISW